MNRRRRTSGSIKRSLAAFPVSTRSPRSTSRDTAGTEARNRGSVAHIPSKKDASDNVVEPEKEYFLSWGYRQRYPSGGNSLRGTSSTQKLWPTSLPQDTWKHQTQMLRGLVRPSPKSDGHLTVHRSSVR